MTNKNVFSYLDEENLFRCHLSEKLGISTTMFFFQSGNVIRTGGSCSRCNLGEKLWIQMIKLTLLVVTAPFPSDHTASNKRTLYIEHYDV